MNGPVSLLLDLETGIPVSSRLVATEMDSASMSVRPQPDEVFRLDNRLQLVKLAYGGSAEQGLFDFQRTGMQEVRSLVVNREVFERASLRFPRSSYY